ncbi:MAG: type III-B CRISPR module RAMP protein Cmr1 [Methanosarcinales archaeon]|uniref:Type III-B CRISPR module RAMP protein Cmr1 n=1 Tax=Candidatus Ethanoperedens thermophilum TaxID=2766897 RepID=A0A848D9U8_9EURY|nr:type III-B CRISPR module RAMP protein Cmr1 [Candidatus Ethanoperedens thermophilum]
MKPLEFNVKFITPLLIGGAENNVDKNGLTGKALRGAWRFWCRALIGGVMGNNRNREDLSKLESDIFGSDKIKIGSKFRIAIEEQNTNTPNSFDLGFKKKGFPEGTSYSITILPRNTMSGIERKVLLATIWVWGNLGAVGNRERRGFGSPIIYLNNNSKDPFNFQNHEEIEKIALPLKEQAFQDSSDIKNHLINGLNIIWSVYTEWINVNDINNIEGYMDTLDAPTSAPYFILRSFKQIAVGDQGYVNRNDAITAVHGMRNCQGLGWARGKGRMASPVFIRFHKVVGKNMQDKFLPIFTWCKQKDANDPDNCARNYLTEIGGRKVFIRSLEGDPLCITH